MTNCIGILLASIAMANGPDAPSAEEHYELNPASLKAYMDERFAVGRRMRAAGDPWLKSLLAGADGGSKTYSNHGEYATLAYLYTRDPKYVPMAAELMLGQLGPTQPPGADFLRQTFGCFAFNFAVLDSTGLLTEDQRQRLVDGLFRWSLFSQGVGMPPNTGGYRTADQDQTLGQYFGCLITYLATKKYNPRARECLYGTVVDHWDQARLPVGGIRPTPGPSIRNRGPQQYMVTWSAGGIGPESFQYNYNTPILLINGVLEARILTGDATIFPEFDPYLRQLALGYLHVLNPDVINRALPAARNLPDGYTWGDDEWGPYYDGKAQLAQLTTMGAVIAGALKEDPDVGVTINGFLADLVDYYGANGWLQGGPPWQLAYYHADKPAMLRIARAAPDWRARLAPVHRAPGMGFTLYHTDWTRPGRSSFFMVHTPPRHRFDHPVPYFLDFGLYRNGDWAMVHDVHYGGTPTRWNASDNTLTMAGLSSMWDRGALASEVVPGRHAFVAAGTRGLPFHAERYRGRPAPAFVREARRALLYLPSERSDVVVDMSYVDAVDPRSLSGIERYYPEDRETFERAPASKAWYLHMRTRPRVVGNAASYASPKGQQLVRATVLLPSQPAIAAVDEGQSWSPQYKGNHHIVVTDRADRASTVFLVVIGATDWDVPPVSASLLFQTARHAYLVVRRPGLGDAVIRVGLTPTPRPAISPGSLDDFLADYNGTRPSGGPAEALPGIRGRPAPLYDVAF